MRPDGTIVLSPIKRIDLDKSAPPALDFLEDGRAYITPDRKPPTAWAQFKSGVVGVFSYNFHRTTLEETEKIEAIRKTVASTETGQKLVAELGGWPAITKSVDITFANTGNGSLNAYTRPLIHPTRAGQTQALVLNQELLHEPDDVVAPLLAHELRHVADGKAEQGIAGGLAIPSEFAAHTTQVQVYEELMKGVPPDKREALHAGPRWAYQVFLARIWEDRILERYVNQNQFANSFADDKMKRLAKYVYKDLKDKAVQPGTPQLYYHLNGEHGGLYKTLTSEKDIADLVAQRKTQYTEDPAQRAADEAIMKKRGEIISRSESSDRAFRAQFGYTLP